jgi:hypothetical protein
VAFRAPEIRSPITKNKTINGAQRQVPYLSQPKCKRISQKVSLYCIQFHNSLNLPPPNYHPFPTLKKKHDDYKLEDNHQAETDVTKWQITQDTDRKQKSSSHNVIRASAVARITWKSSTITHERFLLARI